MRLQTALPESLPHRTHKLTRHTNHQTPPTHTQHTAYLLIQQRLSLVQLRQSRLQLVQRVFAALEVNGEAIRADEALLLLERHVGRLQSVARVFGLGQCVAQILRIIAQFEGGKENMNGRVVEGENER
jgi:hypothetical protein